LKGLELALAEQFPLTGGLLGLGLIRMEKTCGSMAPGELEAELQEEAKLALEVTDPDLGGDVFFWVFWGGGLKGMRSGRCV